MKPEEEELVKMIAFFIFCAFLLISSYLRNIKKDRTREDNISRIFRLRTYFGLGSVCIISLIAIIIRVVKLYW